jgi:A/G-specific adenine glycosylase
MSEFASRLIAWHAVHGRHDLPWQNTQDPYRVWLSEIMLQQTQVESVIPYYQRFLEHFPDVARLAAAPLEAVLALWSGLGYYARARNLHRAAQIVVSGCGGVFPRSAAQLAELPGVGRSTAAAIASFCFGERVAILDGNVKRVLCRQFGIEGFPGERAVEQRLWALAETLLPVTGIEIYPQAQMDLGATVCTRSKPACLHCPVNETCVARKAGREAVLPTPRPKKAVPQRSCGVLLVKAGGAVLLEQRPAVGIWGGLYSLPEMVEGESGTQAALRRLGVALPDCREQPSVRHSFTHFTLTLTPWLIELPTQPVAAHDPALRWVDLDALETIGLPAPIFKLLS